MSARTSSLCRRRCSASTACSTSTVARCRSTIVDQLVDHAERPLDLARAWPAAAARASTSAASRRSVSASCCSSSCWRSCRPALRTSSVGAARRQRRGAPIEFGAQLATGPGGVDLGLLVGFETRQQGGQLVGAPLFALHRRPRRSTSVASSASRSVTQFAQLALRPGEPLRRGAELARRWRRVRARGRPRSCCAAANVALRLGRARASTVASACGGGLGGARSPRRARPPSHRYSPRRCATRSGRTGRRAAVTTTASGWARAASTAVVMSLDAHRVPEQAVEQFGDAGPRRPDVRADGLAEPRVRWRDTAVRRVRSPRRSSPSRAARRARGDPPSDRRRRPR